MNEPSSAHDAAPESSVGEQLIGLDEANVDDDIKGIIPDVITSR